MRASVLLTVGSALLVAGNARANTFPSGLIEGVGVNVTPAAFKLAQAQALRAAGVSVVRTIFAPSVDFGIYDAFVDICAAAGLRIYGSLNTIDAHSNPYCRATDWGEDLWWCYGTQDFRNHFDDFVWTTVTRYPNRGITWELWNEPNMGFWPKIPYTTKTCSDPDCASDSACQYCCEVDANSHQPVHYCTTESESIQTAATQYMQLAMGVDPYGEWYPQGALQIIRDADPEATIVAPAVLSFPDLSPPVDPTAYLETLIHYNNDQGLLSQNESRENRIDGLSVHFYRYSRPEDNAPNMASIQNQIDQMGDSGIPIVSGESGYTLVSGQPITPQTQADYLQRMMLLNFSQHIPLSIWFEDQDRPDNDPQWYFGLFHRYCDTKSTDCANLCDPNDRWGQAKNCKTTTDSDVCANVCAANPNECRVASGLTWCLPHAYWYQYGDPKPAFYAMKTLTQSLTQWSSNATFRRKVDDGSVLIPSPHPTHPNTHWMVFKAPYDILVGWNDDDAISVNENKESWGTYLLTGTPLYVGAPMTWTGNDRWSGSSWNVDGHPWSWFNGFQAVFGGTTGTVNVDGEYMISGIHFLAREDAGWGILEHGKLRFTPGGGNLYVGEGFNQIWSVLADARDRDNLADPGSDDPITYTNTPETFVLRKSGPGSVGLMGDNTFHGRVLVGEGLLNLGSSRALGASDNPVTLAGGGIDFNSFSPNMTASFTVASSGQPVGNWRSNTTSRYTFSSGTIADSVTLTVGGGGTLELAGPISGNGGLNKIDSGTLILNNSGNTYSGATIVSGGTLAGNGRMGGELVVNGGTISPGSNSGELGSLLIGKSVTGSSVTFTGGSTLNIDLGPRAGSCDSLEVGGAVTLAGRLNVIATQPWEPGSCAIIRGATSMTGQFANVSLPEKYHITYNANAVVVTKDP